MRARTLASLALIGSAAALAQMTMTGMNHPDPRPVVLMPGVGNTRHPIRTTSPEAQRFFDQGIDFIYAFNHYEAFRSFQKASELDPSAPMPLWGVALAVGPNYNDIDIGHERAKQAVEALMKAKALAKNGPAIEAAYVDALLSRYSSEYTVKGKEYGEAMKALTAKYPDDLDAATLYADSLMALHPWQLWTLDGKPTDGTEVIVATLKSVLARDPNHIGANHMLIHAVEASGDPGAGLASAKRLETLAPEAGHLVHMPSHIYQRVGNFEGAAEANQKAIIADENYAKGAMMDGPGRMYDAMYLTHNIHFLAAACMMDGRSACAVEAADKLVKHVMPIYPGMHEVEWFMPTQPWVLVRFGMWGEILKAPPVPQDMAVLGAMWHYARGCSYAGLRKVQQASAEREALAKGIATLPEKTAPDFMNPAKTVMNLALTALDARIDEAKGDRAAVIAEWKKAVAVWDTLAYNEPADWYYPVRESLGGALLRDGKAPEAEAVFRRDLEINPGSGRSLYGLWQSLAAQKKDVDAARVKKEFEVAWARADVKLEVGSL